MDNENSNIPALTPSNPTDNTIPDFLAGDLSTLDTSMPLLKEGIYDLLVAKVEVKTNTNGISNLRLAFRTTQDGFSTTEEPLHKGFPINHSICLTQTGGLTSDMIRRSCASLVQAAGKTNFLPVSQFEGEIIRCKVRIQPERVDKKTGLEYPASNSISSFVKA